MPFEIKEIPKNGSLSAMLSFLTGRTIQINSLQETADGIKAVSKDETVFLLNKLDHTLENYYFRLDSALRKEALSRNIRHFFGCFAVLEIENKKFEEYHSGIPIIAQEMLNGKSFKDVLDNFSNEDKFDHDVKSKLFAPLSLIAEMLAVNPGKYMPFVDNFSVKFMSLLTSLETESNIQEISEARRSLGRWLPLIRKRPLSAIHGNFLPENISLKNKLFSHEDFIYGDSCIDIAGIIFGLVQSSYQSYGKIKEPYITAASLVINAYSENGIKDINKLLVPYLSYFSLKKYSKTKNKHFLNLALNILLEQEFDINETDFLMELDMEVEKHEAED